MWICPICERELRNEKQWHNCVKVDIGGLFKNKAKELEFIFDKLLSEITEWENVAVSAMQNCIVFVHNQTFLIVRPMKKQLDLKFYSSCEQNRFPVIKSSAYSGRFENHIRVSGIEEQTHTVYTFIKQSYLLL